MIQRAGDPRRVGRLSGDARRGGDRGAGRAGRRCWPAEIEKAYQTLAPALRPRVRYRSGVEAVEAEAATGGADTEIFEAALLEDSRANGSAELERGVCLVGPHRDDLELRLGDRPAKGFASHGESWSMALSLRLAAYELLRSEGADPVLLLDDVFAELDDARRARWSRWRHRPSRCW